MSEIAREQADVFIAQLAAAAEAVISQIAGEPCKAESQLAEAADGGATSIQLEMSGAVNGRGEIVLSAAMSAQFAALLTGEPAPDDPGEPNEETREAAAELLQQICGNAADRMRRSLGSMELKCMAGERPAIEEGEWRQLRLARAGGTELQLALHLCSLQPAAVAAPAGSGARPAAAAAATPPAGTSATASAPSSAASSASPAAAPPQPSPAGRNLDLLLDVELGATLRFGTRQMPLKEIVELCSGSVVQLDRKVQDPVDLLIDGRLIAQGEVVIVGGNYGLRITRVGSPGDKIACLP